MKRLSKTTLLATTLALLASPVGAQANWPSAPDPGGSEKTAVGDVPQGKFMGFNDDAGAALHGIAATEYVELARTIGGNVIRTNVDWRHAEPWPDHWDENWWTRWGALYDAAIDRGMRPIFVVGMAPPWARDPEYSNCTSFGACEYPPAREADEQWREYVAEVAQRFPRAMIEVWNEPNLRLFWESGADPERFAELQAAAYDAVKAVSPQTMVIAGGFSNVQSTGQGHMALAEFLDRAYAASPSLKGHMDSIGFHPYPYSSNLGQGSLFAKSFHDVRRIRAKHGDEATPLFVTEVGVSAMEVDAAHQTDVMLRIYRRTMSMADVEGVVFHRAIEPADTTADRWELGAGWVRYGASPPEPRPVYCVFVAEASRSYPGCDGVVPLLTRIKSAPLADIATSGVEFAFESPNYGANYQCSLDSGSFSPCWGPIRYEGLGEGVHGFEVRTIGPDGELEESPAQHQFTVDLTSPDTTIEHPPLPVGSASPLPFAFASNEAGSTFECAIDAEPFGSCDGVATSSTRLDGAHVFAARAVDPAGNIDASAAETDFEIDSAGPASSVSRLRSAGTRRPAFDLTSPELAATFECALARRAFAPCYPHYKVQRLQTGRKRLRVHALDRLGNVGVREVVRFRVV